MLKMFLAKKRLIQLIVLKFRYAHHFPASIFLFKVNNKRAKKKVWNMFNVNNKHQNDFNDVVLVSLLST